MQLTIIPSDGAVYKDGVSVSHLTLEGVPSEIHALQWNGVEGWVEFNNGTPNETIENLPEWAVSSVSLYETALATLSVNEQAITQPEVLSYDQKLFLIKVERDKRLSASDWTQLADVVESHDDNWVTAWKIYRQSLRDLPESITDIDSVSFPLPPV